MDCAPEDLRAAEFLVFLVLGEIARDGTRWASLPAPVIAFRARVSTSTVYKAQHELVNRGLLIRGGKAHVGVTQTYRIPHLVGAHRNAIKSLPPREGTAPVDNPSGVVVPAPRAFPWGEKSLPPREGQTVRTNQHLLSGYSTTSESVVR